MATEQRKIRLTKRIRRGLNAVYALASSALIEFPDGDLFSGIDLEMDENGEYSAPDYPGGIDAAYQDIEDAVEWLGQLIETRGANDAT